MPAVGTRDRGRARPMPVRLVPPRWGLGSRDARNPGRCPGLASCRALGPQSGTRHCARVRPQPVAPPHLVPVGVRGRRLRQSGLVLRVTETRYHPRRAIARALLPVPRRDTAPLRRHRLPGRGPQRCRARRSLAPPGIVPARTPRGPTLRPRHSATLPFGRVTARPYPAAKGQGPAPNQPKASPRVHRRLNERALKGQTNFPRRRGSPGKPFLGLPQDSPVGRSLRGGGFKVCRGAGGLRSPGRGPA